MFMLNNLFESESCGQRKKKVCVILNSHIKTMFPIGKIYMINDVMFFPREY